MTRDEEDAAAGTPSRGAPPAGPGGEDGGTPSPAAPDAESVGAPGAPRPDGSGPRRPTLAEAVTPLMAMGVLLGVGYGWLGYPVELLLLGAAAVAGGVARRLGRGWREMQAGIVDALARAMPAILILISVGALIGTWIAAGTIPLLIYWGLDLLSPRYFLVTASVLCSVVSVCTGTSWGTAGTIGVALMGVAGGLGIPAGAAGGAIVAGAYFGDKLSPFSDTTNLAPAVVQANLFDHIRWLLWTTLPAWLLGLGAYLVVGLSAASMAVPDVEPLRQALAGSFGLSPVVLLPVAVVLWFAFTKRPTLPGILLASLVAALLAVVVQGVAPGDALASAVSGFVPDTGSAEMDELLARGGMRSMMEVALVILCAFGFAGIMKGCGLLDRVLEAMLELVRGLFGLVASTVATGVVTAVVTGSSYLSVIVPGELFREAYRARNLAAKNLSRTAEDSGTVVVPLVPWSAAGVFMAATLGVPTLEYAPWAVLNYTGFLFALLYGATGVGIAPRIRDDETQPGS